ncbi:BREX protein BrxB domain-containing protein [Arthrobacter humicola]
MSVIDELADSFERQARLPWKRNISPAERVWLVVYDPAIERRLRAQIGEFQHRASKSGHTWTQIDLTDSFGEWMSQHEYAESFFEEPELLSGAALEAFDDFVVSKLVAALNRDEIDEDTIVAVLGTGALFPFTRASRVIETAESSIRGRLAVFFPGHHSGSNYRLLDARDGWNYRAIPIIGGQES